MQTFKHGFTSPLSVENAYEVNGFLAGLRSLYQFIAEETKLKPENRYIDSVKLLEAITSTTNELKPLMDELAFKLKTTHQAS